MSRSAGGAGVVTVQGIEKLAIGALSIACLLNGIVIGWEIAGWPVWADYGLGEP